jgi:hypothetical protein
VSSFPTVHLVFTQPEGLQSGEWVAILNKSQQAAERESGPGVAKERSFCYSQKVVGWLKGSFPVAEWPAR